MSCYKLEISDSLDSMSVAQQCKAFDANVLHIGDKEEFDHLLDTLPTYLNALTNSSNSVPPTFFSVVACQRGILHADFFSMLKKGDYADSSTVGNMQKYVCFLIGLRVVIRSNTNPVVLYKFNMTSDGNVTLCEIEVDMSLLRTSEIGHFNYPQQKRKIAENLNYEGLNVKLFPCDSDEAIPFTFLHDGYYDCFNNLDEKIAGSPELCVDLTLCVVKLYPVNTEFKFCIDQSKRCNGIWDCVSESIRKCENNCSEIVLIQHDEEDCGGCMETTLSDGSCLPSQWFYKDEKYFFYKPRHDEAIDKNKIQQVEEMLASCNETECRLREDITIHVIKCLGKSETDRNENVGLQRDLWVTKCIYLKRRFIVNENTGCANMSHLVNCEKFVCSEGLFKCRNSYCVPYYMVLDGIRDCLDGEDESLAMTDRIFSPKLFQCRKPSILIHPAHVCDGIDHCPTRDDELHCYQECPSGFTCGFGVTEVTDHSKVNYTNLFTSIDKMTRVLIMSGIDLTQVSFTDFDSSMYLFLFEFRCSRCRLDTERAVGILQHRTRFTALSFLDLSCNNINIAESYRLYLTNLSHTSVEIFTFFIDNTNYQDGDLSFSKLTLLFFVTNRVNINFNYLNVSNTNLQMFIRSWRDSPESNVVEVFNFSTTVKVLDLRNTSLVYDNRVSEYLKSLTIVNSVYGDSFKLCCSRFSSPSVDSVKCYAPNDPVSTCDNLLGFMVKRALVWLIGITGLATNITIVAVQLVSKNNVQMNSRISFAISVVLSDLITGVYLLIIAGADIYYRDDYVLYDTEWRDSSLCKAAGFLATLSYVASGVSVCLVTFQLYFLNNFPATQRQTSKLVPVTSCCCVWCVCFVISLVPVFFPDWQVYSTNSMCIGFPLTMKRPSGLLFSCIIYSVTACIEITLTTVGLILIFKSIFLEGRYVEREIENTKTLSLIILSHIFCASVISITGLLSAVGINISPNRMGWLSVFVLPLNSVINPLLWVWQIVQEKWKAFKASR